MVITGFLNNQKLWMLAASAFSLATNAPLGILVADQLGPVNFSFVSEYLLYSATLSIVIYFGLETYIVKLLAGKSNNEKAAIFKNVLLIRICVFFLQALYFTSFLNCRSFIYYLSQCAAIYFSLHSRTMNLAMIL